MKSRYKALALSLLVFPGCGHFYLKQPKLGAIILSCFSIAMICTIIPVATAAQQISLQMAEGKIALDPFVIAEAISSSPDLNSPMATYSSMSLLVIWLLSAIHICFFDIKKTKDN